MRDCLKNLMMSLALLVAITQPSLADNLSNGIQQPFDWQQTWGSIGFVAPATDTGIPCANLQPKKDIKNIVSTDGTQTTDLSLIKSYQVDINSSGKSSYVLDGNGYFPQYQNPNATTQICTTADGCFVSIYLSGSNTTITSTGGQTQINYNTRTVFDQQVLKWNFISSTDFEAWASGKSYLLQSANPVLVALRNNTNCYNDEIAANNNQCVKYYQYVGDANTGTFVDLFDYQPNGETVGQFNIQFIHTGPNQFITGTQQPSKQFDPNSAFQAPGKVMGSGFGHQLNPGDTVDIQMSNFTRSYTDGTPPQTGFAHYQISNYSNQAYFIPTNTPVEFCSFLDSRQPGVVIIPQKPASGPQCVDEPPAPPQPPVPPAPQPPHCEPAKTITCASGTQLQIMVGNDGCPGQTCVPVAPPCPPPTPETVHFTSWTGDTQCPTTITSPMSIAAQRLCIASTGAYRACSDCVANATLADDKTPDPTRSQGCSVSQECKVSGCMFDSSIFSDQWNVSGFMQHYDGTYPLLSDCYNGVPGPNVWSDLSFYMDDTWTHKQYCDIIEGWICNHAHVCLSAETQVSLPDGTTKRIDAIKAGDTVLGFKHAKDKLKAFTVKSVTTTPDEDLLNINNGALKLTPNHQVVTSKGMKVEASKLKVGDTLLRGDGTKLTVKTIEAVPGKTTVYNLVLDNGGTGFVADGIRVIDYKH